MIAHVCASTGWTWDYVAENVDLPRLECLSRYWDRFPPVHVLVASYMGIKPKTEAIEEDNSHDPVLEEITKMYPQATTRMP